MLKRWFDDGSEFYVPESAIARITEDGVRLTYATDQLEAQGWDQLPADLTVFNRAQAPHSDPHIQPAAGPEEILLGAAGCHGGCAVRPGSSRPLVWFSLTVPAPPPP
jgi:hypothetical protein